MTIERVIIGFYDSPDAVVNHYFLYKYSHLVSTNILLYHPHTVNVNHCSLNARNVTDLPLLPGGILSKICHNACVEISHAGFHIGIQMLFSYLRKDLTNMAWFSYNSKEFFIIVITQLFPPLLPR